MHRVKLSEGLEFSRLVSGMWRLPEWNMTRQELAAFISRMIELGVTTFDHADIYGDYSCEELFGDAVSLCPELRDKIQLVTKCGIRLVSDKHPENSLKYYDTGRAHITASVERSLRNLRTEQIELLLIHRPDPFMDPAETSESFISLRKSGKVKHFGVSNFPPAQFELLSSFLPFPLVTNQIEISPLCLKHFEDGTLAKCQEKRIHPMAWSPLAGGRLFRSDDASLKETRAVLRGLAEETGASSIDQVILAWLLVHPAGIIPILGSGRISRIESALKSLDLKLDRRQWFRILQASTGAEVP